MKNKVGQIKSIWRYPVKSMVGDTIPRGAFSKDGLIGDRLWTLWDESSQELVGGKQFKNIMQLSATYLNPENITNDPSVRVFFPDGNSVNSDDPDLNDLISAFVGHPLLLKQKSSDKKFFLSNTKNSGMKKVRQQLGMPADDSMKNIAIFPLVTSLILQKYASYPGVLHDVYPIHFLTQNTLDWLSRNHQKGSFDARRFRPNFFIDTANSLGDYPERNWQEGYLEIGEVVIKVGVPTIRCSMPAQKQIDLEQDFEVAKALQITAKQFVGSYGKIIETGSISQGDEVVYKTAKKFWQIQARWGKKIREPLVMTNAKVEKVIDNLKKKPTGPNQILIQQGFSNYEIVKIEKESQWVKSFYLKGENYYSHLAGQHLMIGLESANQKHPLIRAYSISNYNSAENSYRISIKKESEGALVSNHFHNKLKVGDKVFVKRPKGNFFLHPHETRPIVFLAMGIGITPFMSMLSHLSGKKSRNKLSLFYAVKNGEQHSFKEEIKEVSKSIDLEFFNFYSAPLTEETEIFSDTRLTIETVKSNLSSKEAVFFLCGTNKFMFDMYNGLLEWGIDVKDIHYEHFSNASFLKPSKPGEKVVSHQIHFAKSGLKAIWNGSKNLLEIAESCGLNVEFGCRYGMCDACKVDLQSGSFTYENDIAFDVEEKSLLMCCAKPNSDLVIDL